MLRSSRNFLKRRRERLVRSQKDVLCYHEIHYEEHVTATSKQEEALQIVQLGSGLKLVKMRAFFLLSKEAREWDLFVPSRTPIRNTRVSE